MNKELVEVIGYIEAAGIEVILAKRKSDMRIVGLHLIAPSIDDLITASWEALYTQGCTAIILYLWEF